MELPPDLLQRSPQEAARRIALAHLEAARAAARRLAEGGADGGSFHGFRVALRRLRSTLRTWRGPLGRSVRKRHRRLLAEIQEATGVARDAEVALEWLDEQRPTLRTPQRLALAWLAERLSARRARAGGEETAERLSRFETVAAELQRRLAMLREERNLLDPDDGAPFAVALAARARELARELERRARHIASVDDREEAHAARIAGKRLRYALEPLRRHVEQAGPIVKRCKKLQDALGELNDAYVLGDELASSLVDAEAEHARRLHELVREGDELALARASHRSSRTALLELGQRVQVQIGDRLERFQKKWAARGLPTLLERVETMAAWLEAEARRPVEIERKYLLSGLPDAAVLTRSGVEAFWIDQGWLPGQRLLERVRRIRTTRGEERYFRTVKSGRGVERLELEEETPAELFHQLWPLTEGRRIAKQRYRIPAEGGLVFEIDEFHDRELVLAEVELEDPRSEPRLPDWLSRLVVREVTDDVRYTNWALAGAP